MQRIVNAGNTVIVVEHNEQVLRAADLIIELGPEGGNKGGQIIVIGQPRDIRTNRDSVIDGYLSRINGQ